MLQKNNIMIEPTNELYCSFDLKGSKFQRQAIKIDKLNKSSNSTKLDTLISYHTQSYSQQDKDDIDVLIFNHKSTQIITKRLAKNYRETTLKDLDFEYLVRQQLINFDIDR